jgi:hypothetical protein
MPESLSMLTSLKYLYAQSNLINTFPSITLLTDLLELQLADNLLTGEIPDTFANPNLYAIYLQNNQLSGSLPASWTTLYALRVFNASANDLDGTLPLTLGALTSLREWDMSNNDMNSEIPDSIGYLRLLTTFRLGVSFIGFFISLNQVIFIHG